MKKNVIDSIFPQAYFAMTPYPLKAEGVIFDPNV